MPLRVFWHGIMTNARFVVLFLVPSPIYSVRFIAPQELSEIFCFTGLKIATEEVTWMSRETIHSL